jgi:Leucine-rich repeat (LRR) protein
MKSIKILNWGLFFNRLLPRELAFLSELRLLDLNGNELQGVIPHLMLTRLTRLEKLHLHMNDLFGQLPTELGNLKALEELTMFGCVRRFTSFFDSI